MATYKTKTYKVKLYNNSNKATISRPNQGSRPLLTSKQAQYVRKLGYTPQSTPTYMSERTGSGLKKGGGFLLDLISRGESAGTKALSEAYRSLRETNLDPQSRPRNLFEAITGSNILRAKPKNIVNMTTAMPRGFWQGLTGDEQFSGDALYSQIVDDPIYTEAAKNSKAFEVGVNVARKPGSRIVGGIGLGMIADPTTYVGVGAMSKGLGVTDNVLKPIGRQALKLPGVSDNIAKYTFSMGRTPDFIAAKRGFAKTTGMGSEISGALNKLIRGVAKDEDILKLKLFGGEIAKSSGKINPQEWNRIIDEAYAVSRNLGKKGLGEDVQKQLYKQAGGVIKKNAIDETGQLALNTAKNYSNDLEKLSNPVRKLLDESLTPQLVKAGVISPETAQKGMGNYLRALYKSNPDTATENISKLVSNAGGKGYGAEKGLTELKKQNVTRAMEFLTENPNQLPISSQEFKTFKKQINTLAKQIKEEQKVSTRVAQEMASRQLEGELVAKIGQENLDNFAHLKRLESGLIDDFSLVAPETVEQAITYKAKTDLLGVALKESRNFADETMAKSQGFLKIPDGQKYGQLAGKYVPQAVYTDIVGILNPAKGTLTRFTNYWKKLKLFSPFNTATVQRNAVSNFMLNSMVEDGLPVWRQDVYAKAMYEMEKKVGLWDEFIKQGGTLNTFASQEVKKGLRGKTGTLLNKAENVSDTVFQGARIPYTSIGFGQSGFSGVEEWGKYAQYIYQRGKGKTPQEAMNIVNKALFNYAELPVGFQRIRDQFVPFLSFKYFATQLAIDTFWNRTGKLSSIPRAMRGVEGLTANQANDRDLPQYMRENRSAFLRVPWKDEQGNPRYIDTTYLNPFGDLGGGFTPQDILLGNPFVRQAVEQGINRNLYFDQEITRPGMSTGQKATERLKYFVGQMGPKSPVIPFSYENQKIVDALKGRTDKYGRPNDLPSVLSNTVGGIKATRVNPGEQRASNRRAYDAKLREFDDEISKVRKDQRLTNRERANQISEIKARKQAFIISNNQ